MHRKCSVRLISKSMLQNKFQVMLLNNLQTNKYVAKLPCETVLNSHLTLNVNDKISNNNNAKSGSTFRKE